MAEGIESNHFSVIWADSNIEKIQDDLDTTSLIRRMVRGRLFAFNTIDRCINHILDQSSNERILLIVSNSFGPKIAPFIHDFPQIHTIYIYCRKSTIAESWSKSYRKINRIFTSKQALLRQIGNDIGVFNESEDLPMSIFHLEEKQNTLQKLTNESVKFLWYRSVLTVLPLMAKYCNSKEEMLAECRKCYVNDEIENKKIDEFAQTYEPHNAFWWYTYDSFVYRLLNKALRTQNLEIIFKFRFFINDLHKQIHQFYREYLMKESRQHQLTVYRGQRLTMNEVDFLRTNIGEIISMNSFLSATTIRAIAEIFADTSDQTQEDSPLQSVLFIIDLCNFDDETAPFAFIENYSCCQDEEEVLFSIGAIFQVESVDKQDQIWHVHLQFNRQQNQQHKDLLKYMLKQIGTDPSPSTLGWFLYRMADYNKAERYVQLLLKQLPADDFERSNAYNLLGLIYKDVNRLSDSIKAYEKALKIYSHFDPCLLNDCSQIIATQCNLGLAYLAFKDVTNADKYQQQAEDQLLKSSCANDPLLAAMIVTLRGKIQTARGEYARACDNFRIALQRKKMILPWDHPSTASTFVDLGVANEHMGYFDQALNHFIQALKIREKTLPERHVDLGECFRNIARLYDRLRQPQLAVEYKKVAQAIEINDIRD